MRRTNIPSVFSWRVFLSLYIFFLLNTVVTTQLMEWWLVKPHPKFSVTWTAHIYQLMQSNSSPAIDATSVAARGFTGSNWPSFFWVVMHNSLLPLIATGLFSLATYLPTLRNRVFFHVLEYVRFVLVLLFFAFSAAILVINAVLIPFILASVAYVAQLPVYALSLLILVHGILEYAALSLVIMIGIRTWNFVRVLPKTTLSVTPANTRFGWVGYLSTLWYQQVFGAQSLAHRFLVATHRVRLSAFAAYGLAIAIFFVAASVEVYVSPRVEAHILQSSQLVHSAHSGSHVNG